MLQAVLPFTANCLTHTHQCVTVWGPAGPELRDWSWSATGYPYQTQPEQLLSVQLLSQCLKVERWTSALLMGSLEDRQSHEHLKISSDFTDAETGCEGDGGTRSRVTVENWGQNRDWSSSVGHTVDSCRCQVQGDKGSRGQCA